MWWISYNVWCSISCVLLLYLHGLSKTGREYFLDPCSKSKVPQPPFWRISVKNEIRELNFIYIFSGQKRYRLPDLIRGYALYRNYITATFPFNKLSYQIYWRVAIKQFCVLKSIFGHWKDKFVKSIFVNWDILCKVDLYVKICSSRANMHF